MIKVIALRDAIYFDTMKDVYNYYDVSNEDELQELFDNEYRKWGMEAPEIEVIN